MKQRSVMRKWSIVSKTINVFKTFGPTIQGEGLYAGTICSFIRTAGCDNNCIQCDTKYAQKLSSGLERSIDEVCDEIAQHNTKHVVITGGNPAIQKNLTHLVRGLSDRRKYIHVETQGTVWNEALWRIKSLAVSPKPPSTGNCLDIDKLMEFMKKVKYKEVQLKVVVWNETDIDYAKAVHKKFPSVPFILQVGNNITDDDDIRLDTSQRLLLKYRGLIDNIIEKGIDDDSMMDIRILPQIHTLLYGNKRGV